MAGCRGGMGGMGKDLQRPEIKPYFLSLPPFFLPSPAQMWQNFCVLVESEMSGLREYTKLNIELAKFHLAEGLETTL